MESPTDGLPSCPLLHHWVTSVHIPCRPRYRLIGKKGEGTFSEVLKAQGIKNGKYVAIKCMKNHFDSLDQVRERPTSGLRMTQCRQAWWPTDSPLEADSDALGCRPVAWSSCCGCRALSTARAPSPPPSAGEQPARDPSAAPAVAPPWGDQAVRGLV